ncbi:LysR substrate-binding domain-containing protein [Chromobacterium subtsugae]|uniref:LysR substrate-binding domain-containing protein n=1 Tax=Chromobacterium subtsugae TaxID=251747 RepID=UPI002E8072C5|nr:LysR substrate-binding domain-containing protein [Chromobacterium subtsugae]
MLEQSAVAGLGVGLLPYCLAYEDIVEGRLIMLPHIALPSGYGYRVFCRDDPPKMRQFVEWLQEEVAAMRLMPRAPAAKP